GQLPVAPGLRDLTLEGDAVATRQEVSRLPAILHAGREEVVFPDRDIQFLFPVLVVITKDHHVIAVLKLAPALKCGLDVLPLEVGLGTDISAQREYEQRGDDCKMPSGVTLQAHTYYSPCAAASSLPVGSGSSGATNGARHSGQPIWWSFGPRFNCSLRSAISCRNCSSDSSTRMPRSMNMLVTERLPEPCQLRGSGTLGLVLVLFM